MQSSEHILHGHSLPVARIIGVAFFVASAVTFFLALQNDVLDGTGGGLVGMFFLIGLAGSGVYSTYSYDHRSREVLYSYGIFTPRRVMRYALSSFRRVELEPQLRREGGVDKVFYVVRLRGEERLLLERFRSKERAWRIARSVSAKTGLPLHHDSLRGLVEWPSEDRAPDRARV